MDPVTETTFHLPGHGSLKGLQLGTSARRFVGVPYAQPPIGPLRWKKPIPFPEDHVYGVQGEPQDCTSFGPICPQPDYIVDGDNYSLVEGSEHSEDCLRLNIWLPVHDPPPGEKWPVFAWIHGGWLQIGNPCHVDEDQPPELIAEDGAGLQAIVVAIGYRLNIFGFLAGHTLKGNFGLWDQRCALEWITRFIHLFGGDKDNVTLGGLSAGAYSAHCQLQYELLHTNGSQQLFKRVFLCSNAIPVQPKRFVEANEQFEDVCHVFGIPLSLDSMEIVERLRAIPAEEFIRRMPEFKWHTFRAVTDNEFINEDMIKKLRDGTFASAFRDRGYRLLIGETENEQYMYSKVNPPSSKEGLQNALENYYPSSVCQKVIQLERYKKDNEPVDKLFGRITSDLQVRAPIRALCKSLVDAGVPLNDVIRYRSSCRAKCFDKIFPVEAGVTHSADMLIWWFIRRLGYKTEEESIFKEWLQQSLIPFIYSKSVDWTCTDIRQYTQLSEDRSIRRAEDVYWEGLIEVSSILDKA